MMSSSTFNPYQEVPNTVQKWSPKDIPVNIDSNGTVFYLSDLYKYEFNASAKLDKTEVVKISFVLNSTPLYSNLKTLLLTHKLSLSLI
jgi:hypothetical protein